MIESKQIKKILSKDVIINNFSTSTGYTKVITSDLNTTLLTAGVNNTSVVLTPSNNDLIHGVVVDTPHNLVYIYEQTTNLFLNDGFNNIIYGRLTESSGVYTISYYILENGVETPYNFLINKTTKIIFTYRYNLKDLPTTTDLTDKSFKLYQEIKHQNIPINSLYITNPLGATCSIFKKNVSVVLESTLLNLKYLLSSGDVWYILKSNRFYFYIDTTPLFNNNGFLYTDILNEAGTQAAASEDLTRDYLSNNLTFDSSGGAPTVVEKYFVQDLSTTSTQATLLARDTITQNFTGGVYEIISWCSMRATTTDSVIEWNLLIDGTPVQLIQQTCVNGRREVGVIRYYVTLTAGTHTISTTFRRTLAGSTANIDASSLKIEKW